MSSKYSRRNRCAQGGFLKVPKTILRNPNYLKLSAWATKLLFDIGEQYVGNNNGDLCATWVFMRDRGWKSKDTLSNAIQELRYYELIVQTQYGGLNKPSLYALPWFRVDKANKDTELRVGDRPKGWQTEKKFFKKVSTQRREQRKKKQARLAGQIATVTGAVRDPISLSK